ncbi:ScpA family protein [Halorubellus sp. PRR65]|uniref:ScpA family protein n=1 Tax=Halorubellus sp. PRR65 TaxID=3098148 RepID=UPI002B25F54E|nr:ScpA family protein [Halorubellus sp. PRR65]
MTDGGDGEAAEETPRADGGSDPASMLDIAGHEDRERPGDADDPFGSDDGGEGAESGGDGDADPYADAADAADATAETMDEVLPDEDAMVDGDDDEVEPVEVLVTLAENGEIDPWDIDVVRVTEEFLDALDDADLRSSGRALFYASVLVRMKGDELLHGSDDDEEDELEPWEEPFAEGPEGGTEGGERPGDFDPVAALEDEMERRLDRKHARGTPETLDELVRELREAERGSWWKRQREYDTSDSPSGYGRGEQTLDYRSADDFRVDDEPTEADVTGTTHEEDIESVIEDVEATVREHYDAGRDEVLFREVAAAYGSRVQTFLAVLFMSHRGTVRLQQDELFGDLWVQDPNAATASESAAAD